MPRSGFSQSRTALGKCQALARLIFEPTDPTRPQDRILQVRCHPGAATRVPPPETRHGYVPIGSPKTSLFLKVSGEGTRIPAVVCGFLCCSCFQPRTALGKCQALARLIFEPTDPTRPQDRILQVRCHPGAATRVPPPETRHGYVSIGSPKTSLFLKVSGEGTRIPAVVCGFLCCSCFQPRTALGKCQALARLIFEPTDPTRPQDRILQVRCHPGAATRVPPPETRHGYVSIGSPKTSLFLKVSGEGTRIPAVVCGFLCCSCFQPRTALGKCQALARLIFETAVPTRPQDRILQVRCHPGAATRVPPPETRHGYVPIGSPKTSLFLKVSGGGTHIPAVVCGFLCYGCSQISTAYTIVSASHNGQE